MRVAILSPDMRYHLIKYRVLVLSRKGPDCLLSRAFWKLQKIYWRMADVAPCTLIRGWFVTEALGLINNRWIHWIG